MARIVTPTSAPPTTSVSQWAAWRRSATPMSGPSRRGTSHRHRSAIGHQHQRQEPRAHDDGDRVPGGEAAAVIAQGAVRVGSMQEELQAHRHGDHEQSRSGGHEHGRTERRPRPDRRDDHGREQECRRRPQALDDHVGPDLQRSPDVVRARPLPHRRVERSGHAEAHHHGEHEQRGGRRAGEHGRASPRGGGHPPARRRPEPSCIGTQGRLDGPAAGGGRCPRRERAR